MRFEHPLLLWLLLVIPPAMVLFFWWAMHKRQSLLVQFIQARLLPGLLSGLSPARQYVRFGCLTLAVACLIVALARPQWGFAWEEVKQRGLDIVLAIDTSRSMLAEDIAPDRLARARLAAMDLMQLAKSDRLGLVAFAGVAFLQCPLTFDDGAFRQSLDVLDVNLLPQGGTAMAEAIQAALPAYREGDNHKILILFTDGEDHAEGALEAAQAAAKADVRIFTVGIGSTEGEVLRARDASGRVDYVRDEQGNVVKSRLNEELLQKVAAAGNGFYLRLQGSKTMELLYQNGLAPLPRAEGQERLVKRYYERFHWPLGVAILLLLLEILLPESARKSRAATAAVGGLPRVAATILVLLGLSLSASASPSSALRDYKSGKYDQALKQFQDLQKKDQDPRLHFNAGAAAYREGKLEEAIEEFSKAANAKELDLQQMAYYNRGNSRFYLGAQAPDPKTRSEQWQNSLQDFESALKLNPKDPDAQYNRELVKKEIEELKQQQKNQQQQNQDQSQDQKDQQQQDQQQQQQNQGDQKEQQEQQQTQSQDQQQDGKQSQPQPGDKQDSPKPEESKADAQQAQQQEGKDGQKPDEQKAEQAQAKAAAGEDKPDEEKPDPSEEQTAPGQMTREQAQRLLDSQKADEKLIPMKPQKDPRDPAKPRKDW
jgi:Ca-activated chloride channel family protein